jgi:hypothetical protein
MTAHTCIGLSVDSRDSLPPTFGDLPQGVARTAGKEKNQKTWENIECVCRRKKTLPEAAEEDAPFVATSVRLPLSVRPVGLAGFGSPS